jgi:hypothetical protein
MDVQERAEVRDMIHGILSGWNARAESYMSTTNNSLNNIDTHLKTLNHTVAKHQTVIDKNLPHTIAHCTQKDTIESIEKTLVKLNADVVTRKALNGLFWKLFGAIGGSVGILIAVWEFFLKVQF